MIHAENPSVVFPIFSRVTEILATEFKLYLLSGVAFLSVIHSCQCFQKHIIRFLFICIQTRPFGAAPVLSDPFDEDDGVLEFAWVAID